MDIVVYGSIVGRLYDKARSLFMHRGGKMKFGAVKSLGSITISGGLFY